MSSFFLPGETTDQAYVNVRESPNLAEAKRFVESLWPRFQPLADSNFQTDAKNHFLQRFWEMYLACSLMERGLELHKVDDAGLEYYFNEGGRRVWLEAVAPSPGKGPDRVPEIVYGEAYTVPSEKVILRFTSAMRDKLLKIKKDQANGRLMESDRVLLAINSRGIPHGPYGGDMPFFLKACLPFGNLTLELDPKKRQIVDRYHTYRPTIQKQSEGEVRTTTFLDADSAVLIGVLHSAVDCANKPTVLGGDFQLLHNPNAAQPLPRATFSWCEQYEYAENELRHFARGKT